MADKSIERWPIRFAEDGQGLCRLCGLRFARLQNDGPVCRSKRGPSFLQRSRYRSRESIIANFSGLTTKITVVHRRPTSHRDSQHYFLIAASCTSLADK